MSKKVKFPGFLLQETPAIYAASLPGRWLLERTSPSWRIQDPIKGFQRTVREDRARQIALNVLEQNRTFPNAIVLATDATNFSAKECNVEIEPTVRFLVVDGQHRLWAQYFSEFEANYACLIHVGLSEVDMANLFLEINDNQKRVPSSLRWDLVRLVKRDIDLYTTAAAELTYLLAIERESPLFQLIDLTGERSEIELKQGSIAPEIKNYLQKTRALEQGTFDIQYPLLVRYLKAMEIIEGSAWGTKTSVFYKARTLRALLKLLVDIVSQKDFKIEEASTKVFTPYLRKINRNNLEPDVIRAKQGAAGIKAIYDELFEQVFG